MALIITLPASFTASAYSSEEHKEEEPSSSESYIQVPTFTVTMYHRGRPKGTMTITMLVKVTDSEQQATARKYLPRLNSAYVIEASRLSHDYFDVEQPVNIAMIGDAFQLATNRVLGHHDAHVLISDVIVNNK
ncbi:MAG: hypothetical protein JKY45_14470 [Emcibacter sp.]|nr:hypothetical protein [Emcibacter sp.]